MKKLLLFLGIIFGLNSSAFAIPVNECKIDIYFGNGVWNKQFSSDNCKKDFAAECSQKQLNELIQREIIKNNPILKAKYGKVKLQYNWGEGWDTDLVETFYQLKEAGQLSKWEFFALMDELLTKRAADITGDDIVTMRNKLLAVITYNEQSNINEMLEKQYNESFQYSHQVLLVSHSQGNLFANRVYDNINPTGYKTYFANVQVASPASSVHAAKGKYINGWIDPIINPIPGSMKHNADLDGIGGHQFVAAYLDSKDTYKKIVQAIKDELAALDDPIQTPSQWKISKKPEDLSNCEAIRVEMTHKFDESIPHITDVYPFETSVANYKLYPTKDEEGSTHYVIDRCGGKTIKETWENKQDNECYLLDPLADIIKTKNLVYFMTISRPSSSIYSTILYMCRADLQNFPDSQYCIQVANGQEGNGYSFWDSFGVGPCQGYDRYNDSKWAGTEYAGIFYDMILTLVPFEDASGWYCSNYYYGCCTCNNNNFKTYYQLSWNDLFENAYQKLKGE